MGCLTNFEKFQLRMKASGGNLRQERINSMRNLFDATFADDPSYYSDVAVLNRESVNCRIYDYQSATKRDGCMRIQTEYGHPLLKGDLVYWQDIWWLCTHQQNIHDIYWNGVIERTNHYLKWKNADGKIIERWCRAEDGTKYTTGENDAGYQVILPNTRRTVLLTYDEETIQIEEGKRLIIDRQVGTPKVYRVTSIDRISNIYETETQTNGIISLTCVADLFNDQTDNAELMIADYYAQSNIYKLQVNNVDTTSILSVDVGTDFQLDIIATKNWVEVGVEQISFFTSNENVATVNEQGLIHTLSQGLCDITIAFGTEVITLTINVMSETLSDTYALTIVDDDNDLEIIYGMNNTAFVKIYENGIETSNYNFEYELINAEGVASIKSVNRDSIYIVADNNSKNIGKEFILHVWNTSLNIEDQLTFKVVGYF